MSQEEANRIARAVQRVRSSRGALKFGLPTVAALGAGAAVAVAAIPGGGGTITGCYVTTPDPNINQRYGDLRVIDPSARGPRVPEDNYSCELDEATITWNQQGPTGPQGPAGGNGANGSNGAPGAKGDTGTPLIGGTSFGLTNSAGKTFLKLDGIAGESTDKTHKGDIELDSFSLGAVAPSGAANGTGAGAGKVTLQTFTITKRLDKSTPSLFQAAASGKHIKQGILTFARRGRGGRQQDYLKITLSDVLVSSLQDGTSSSHKAPIEQVTFRFAKIEETFLGGSGVGNVTVGWDVKANRVS